MFNFINTKEQLNKITNKLSLGVLGCCCGNSATNS
jgi:hypothetical protein